MYKKHLYVYSNCSVYNTKHRISSPGSINRQDIQPKVYANIVIHEPILACTLSSSPAPFCAHSMWSHDGWNVTNAAKAP